jgi:hypothetical protein
MKIKKLARRNTGASFFYLAQNPASRWKIQEQGFRISMERFVLYNDNVKDQN